MTATNAKDYRSVLKAMKAIQKAADRLSKGRTLPESWKQDAATLSFDIGLLRTDHSIAHRATECYRSAMAQHIQETKLSPVEAV